jgi:hypothetical protein
VPRQGIYEMVALDLELLQRSLTSAANLDMMSDLFE